VKGKNLVVLEKNVFHLIEQVVEGHLGGSIVETKMLKASKHLYFRKYFRKISVLAKIVAKIIIIFEKQQICEAATLICSLSYTQSVFENKHLQRSHLSE
jgi:hypothetical protein